MRLSLRLAFVPVVIAVLACTGGTATPEAPPAPEAPAPAPVEAAPAVNTNLSPPFSTMGLPVGTGQVLESTTNHILVIWEGSSQTSAQLTADWQLAMTKAGYVASETVDTGDANVTAIVYKTTTSAMGLATGMEDGLLFAYVEDITAGGESVVRKGGRPGVGARRGGRGGGGGGGVAPSGGGGGGEGTAPGGGGRGGGRGGKAEGKAGKSQ